MIQFIEVPVLVYTDEQLALIKAGEEVDDPGYEGTETVARYINMSQVCVICKDGGKDGYTLIDMANGDSLVVPIKFEKFMANFQNEK